MDSKKVENHIKKAVAIYMDKQDKNGTNFENYLTECAVRNQIANRVVQWKQMWNGNTEQEKFKTYELICFLVILAEKLETHKEKIQW